MRENDFQSRVIRELKHRMPDAIVLKNDPNYIQGIPDLLVLNGDRWAGLEVKRSASAPYRPNQELYLEIMNKMSFSTTIYPENEKEALDAVQRSLEAGR